MTTATRDLLLEIGVEELPARFGLRALAQLAAKVALALAGARLAHGEIETYGTPRRLALLIRDVVSTQEDRTALVKGPVARMAYGAAGAPTKAALGFARARGVAVEELVVQDDEKGTPYVYVRVHEAGQSADAMESAGAGEDSVAGADVGALEPAEAALWQAFLAVRADVERAIRRTTPDFINLPPRSRVPSTSSSTKCLLWTPTRRCAAVDSPCCVP